MDDSRMAPSRGTLPVSCVHRDDVSRVSTLSLSVCLLVMFIYIKHYVRYFLDRPLTPFPIVLPWTKSFDETSYCKYDSGVPSCLVRPFFRHPSTLPPSTPPSGVTTPSSTPLVTPYSDLPVGVCPGSSGSDL